MTHGSRGAAALPEVLHQGPRHSQHSPLPLGLLCGFAVTIRPYRLFPLQVSDIPITVSPAPDGNRLVSLHEWDIAEVRGL